MVAMPAPVQCSNCLLTGVTVKFPVDRTSVCAVAVSMILVITSSGIDFAVGPLTVNGTIVGPLIWRGIAETAVASFARRLGCCPLVVKQP